MNLFQKIMQGLPTSLNDNKTYADDGWKEVNMPTFVYENVFEKQTFYALRTTRYYFVFTLRKRKHPRGKKPYNVFLLGAHSTKPLSIAEWEAKGDPWRLDLFYVDLFYLESNYQNDFPYDENSRVTSFMKEFDTVNEANIFLEIWKEKVLVDHKAFL